MARFFPLCALALVAFVMVQLSNQAAVEKAQQRFPRSSEVVPSFSSLTQCTGDVCGSVTYYSKSTKIRWESNKLCLCPGLDPPTQCLIHAPDRMLSEGTSCTVAFSFRCGNGTSSEE